MYANPTPPRRRNGSTAPPDGGEPTPDPARPHGPDGELAGVRILVVEDDATSAKLFTVLLSEEGAEVTVATSAEEALARVDTLAPQVVITDLILPRMSGLLLVQLLRSAPWDRQVPLIISVTAFADVAVERMALEAGCAAHLLKPVDASQFAAFVAALVRGTGGRNPT
ncbi:MAG TPA: response regulator [Kofleriaceae bacterium]|nr:response regulator [Kofleriaceae bacterium]